ncbi:related to Sulfite oxidase [Pseudozyma flocculosa]|uniref:Related to Sulfite oxidase n=1 Tax=Pseudozyma flocculosa TaxID=84751 RepID=A0A5C3EWY2_9BASI|nr:related to Sulfite oxidase [Pseudozyma flocculosa]
MSDPSLDTQGNPKDSHFHVFQTQPLNAEPESASLTSHLITPTHLLFHRNHDDLVYPGPAQSSSSPDWPVSLSLSPSLRGAQPLATFQGQKLLLSQIKRSLPTRHVVATLECAGNRRGEFRHQDKAQGIQWGSGVIANVVWSGTSIRDALLHAGLPDPYAHHPAKSLDNLVPSEHHTIQDAAEWARGLHLHMHSTQQSTESDDPNRHEVFAASIPLPTAMHPNQDCILAYAHNGQPLLPSHGFPLRAVIPGHAGARWVKWLSGLTISQHENQSPPMRLDYKILTPPKPGGGDSEDEQKKREWLERVQHDEQFRKQELQRQKPLQRLGASSAITQPADDQDVEARNGSISVKGYAVGQDALLRDLDPSLASHLFVEQLPPDIEWHQAQLSFEPAATAAQESRRRLEACGHVSPASADDVGEGEARRRHREWSWAWCLWSIYLPLPQGAAEHKWAIVAKSVTAAGVEQERVSAWNLRGFCERGWPVVRGLRIKTV